MSIYLVPVDFDPATHPILSLHWFGAKRSIRTIIDRKIDPEVIAAASGGRVPPAPLHEAPR